MVTESPSAPAHPAHSHGAATMTPEPIDPLHEIDGPKTLRWVAFFVVAVFVSLWLLAQAFEFVIGQERQVKVDDRPTLELDALRETERAELSKTEDLGAGFERISIDEAIRRLSDK